MRARFLRFTIAVLIAILAAAPCIALPPIDDDPPPDPGDSPTDYCALTAIGCIAGIVGVAPACATCPSVVGCIGCAGIVSSTVGACLNYMDNCISTDAREGDLCQKSNRCETGGLHCVNNHCTANRGTEPQRCSTERDCQDGLTCLPDGVGIEGGKCWRQRNLGELCSSSAECQAGNICDPNNHSCRTPGCAELVFGQPLNTQNCPCTITTAHPAPQGDCLNGFRCEGGNCTQVTVTVCACDGTDPQGTCTSCELPEGPGPSQPTYFPYSPTCYNFYDTRTYYTCVTFDGVESCGDPETEYILTDSFCV